MKKLTDKVKVVVVGSVISLSVTTVALAHGGAMGVVKERMDLMGDIGKNMKSVAAMMKGETEFDPIAVEAAAKSIASQASKMNALFPDGSLEKPSEALPAIWEDWERFSQLSKDLEIEASYLAQMAATGNKQMTMMHFAKTGKVCSTCHTAFRVKKD